MLSADEDYEDYGEDYTYNDSDDYFYEDYTYNDSDEYFYDPFYEEDYFNNDNTRYPIFYCKKNHSFFTLFINISVLTLKGFSKPDKWG